MKKLFVYRIDGELDITAMNKACHSLIGRHDLASFVASAAAAKEKRTVRTIHEATVTQEAEMVYIDIIADSFLPHQVRNMAGSLIKVGQGGMTTEELSTMIEARTPGLAGPTAPAAGLCLMRVNYPGPLGRHAR